MVATARFGARRNAQAKAKAADLCMSKN